MTIAPLFEEFIFDSKTEIQNQLIELLAPVCYRSQLKRDSANFM